MLRQEQNFPPSFLPPFSPPQNDEGTATKKMPKTATFLCRFLQIRSRWWCKYGHGEGANTVTPSHGSLNHVRTHVLRLRNHAQFEIRDCLWTKSSIITPIIKMMMSVAVEIRRNTQLSITTNDNRSPSASKHSYGLIFEGRTLIHYHLIYANNMHKHHSVLCRMSPYHRPATSILWTIQI